MSEVVDWNSFTVVQLKDHLKKRGLDQTGKKADLVSRLVASDQAAKEKEEKKEPEPDNSKCQTVPDVEPDTIEVEPMDVLETPAVSADASAADVEKIEDAKADASADEVEIIEDPTDVTEKKTEELEQDDVIEIGGDDGAEEEEETEHVKPCAQTDEAKKEAETVEGGEAEATAAADSTMEEGDAKAAEEEEPDVSSQFAIDMPRDRDCFNLTWNSKRFPVPFRNEINADLILSYRARSLLVHPVEFSDLSTNEFRQLIERALKFSIDFHDRSSEKTTTGRVKFLFKSEKETEEVKAELKAYRDTLNIEPLNFEYMELEDDYLPVVKNAQPPNTGSVVQRLLFLGNLPSDVTEATLSGLFPDALRVILPHKEIEENAENIEQTRYAYVEYSSEEEAVTAAETHKELHLNDEKIFVTRAITVRKEKFGLLSDSLRQIFIDKIRKLQRIQKNPYNKSQHDLDEIERTIEQTKEKLLLDSKHRKGWGMLLGKLDESILDKEEDPDWMTGNQRGRGGPRGGRGGRGQARGGNYRGGSGGNGARGGSQGYRRGQISSLITGMGGNQRGSYGYGGSPGMGGYNRGGWNAGYGGSGAGVYQSYYASGDSRYPTQSYGGGYNQFSSGKRRASYDNYSGEWKRGRGSYQQH